MTTGNTDRYTKGEYLANNPDWHVEDAGWKAAAIHQILIKNNIHPSSVTEIGCGAGAVLYELSKLNSAVASFSGYDISPQAISMAAQYENNRLHYYSDDLLSIDAGLPDVLLMIDVLEHVEDYIGFLRKLKNKGKMFVFHIPLDLSHRTMLKPHILFQQRQSVGHIHYFTKVMIEWALADAGYEIIDQVYTKPVTDIKPASTVKQAVKKFLRNTSFYFFPDWSAGKWGNYSMLFLLK